MNLNPKELEQTREELSTALADIFFNSNENPAAYEKFKEILKTEYFGGVILGQG